MAMVGYGEVKRNRPEGKENVQTFRSLKNN